jgi:hypothetical protein
MLERRPRFHFQKKRHAHVVLPSSFLHPRPHQQPARLELHRENCSCCRPQRPRRRTFAQSRRFASRIKSQHVHTLPRVLSDGLQLLARRNKFWCWHLNSLWELCRGCSRHNRRFYHLV